MFKNKPLPTAGASLFPSLPPAMAGFKRGYDGKIAGLYDLDKTLGRGHFAVVKLARHVFTGEQVAVKVIDKTKLDTAATGHLFQEVRCMKLVQHPNIVRLYEVIDTQTKLYLILELGDGGDMFDYIMRHEEGLNEELAKKYFAQIVHAISYCHRLHVVHRDLKPENVVFFEKQGLVKLTDFGFSNKFQPGKKLTTSCGSLAYSAPEILLGDEYDAPAVGMQNTKTDECCNTINCVPPTISYCQQYYSEQSLHFSLYEIMLLSSAQSFYLTWSTDCFDQSFPLVPTHCLVQLWASTCVLGVFVEM